MGEDLVIGVTLGIGEWREVAEFAARRMGLMTGLRCVVLTETPPVGWHPAWMKLRVQELYRGEVLFFDADILSIRPWDPGAFYRAGGRRFAATVSTNAGCVGRARREGGLMDGGWVINSGLFMSSEEDKELLERALGMGPEFGPFYEQTALNRAIQEMGVSGTTLPGELNYTRDRGRVQEGVVNVHFNGKGSAAERLRAMQKIVG